MGFATVASATFTDANDIEYTEAVDVLTAINVINGYTDGSFRPTGNVTRAQMAKMVAYIVAGGEDVGNLYAGANSFSDCTTHWAKGYIAYANKTGIVAGVGNGLFKPEGSVTGTQAAKMMLCALGYDAGVEEYTGTNWAVNVLADAKEAGLLKGLESVDMSKAMTREQAAQLMFNALKADMVKYSNKGAEVDLGNGVVIRPSGSDAEVVTTKESWGGNITNEYTADNKEYTVQLGEKYFSKLIRDTGSDVTDAFGRPSDNWSYKGESICSVTTEAVATFTAKTSAADVAKALKGYKVSDGTNTYKVENDTDRNITMAIKGANSGATFANWPMSKSQTIAEEIAAATANGKLVEIYAGNDNVITDVVTVSYNVGEVTKISTNKAGDVTYTVSGSGNYVDYADADKTDTVSVNGNVTEDSYVTYVKIGSKAYLYATTSIQGNQTRKDQDNKITVNDTVYSLHEKADPAKFNNSSDTFNYYIDQYGFVVATTSTASASTSYAYVIGVNGSVSTTIDGTTPYVEARVALGDGTVGVYEVALEKVKSSDDTNGDYKIKNTDITVYDAKGGGTQTSTSVTDAAKALLGNVYGYTLSSETITFEVKGALGTAKVDDIVTAALTEKIEKDKIEYTVTGGKVVANQSTQFVVYNADKKTATVYTGSNKLPTFEADDQAVAVATVTSSGRATATMVFVNTDKGASSIATDSYVYIDTDKFVVSGSGDDQVYEYTATYADGTTATLTSSDKLASAKALFYVNDDKTVGSKIETDGQFLGEKAMTMADGILSVDTGSYYVTDETQIVYINDDLSEVDGNTGFVVLKESGSKTVAAIFVTKD